MALHVGEQVPVHRPRKICLREVQEIEPCKWAPTGAAIYIDRDAPLDSLQGWPKAKMTGECMVPQSMFKSIRRVVEDALKKMEADDA